MMEADHLIGPLTQIPPGEGRVFEVAGTKVAVFRTWSDAVFATQPECPHRQGPLADGLMGDASVVCPLHERQYDLRTGAGLNTECSITTYPVRLLADGTMVVQLAPALAGAVGTA